ncbi:MAG: chemotaxis protein CheW [Bacteroidales bacterium]|nr:chemotaxis protein CheW [Bacteroidales bacterium]
MRTFIQFSSRNMAKSSTYYLSFELKGNKFAANFPRIYGFAREYTYLPLEGFAQNIPGVALVSTEYIPIIDLSKKIGYTNTSFTGTEKLMILETDVYETDVRFAIPYDQLGDAFELSRKKLIEAPSIGSIFEKGYIHSMYMHENDVVYIIDFEKLIDIDELIDLKVAPQRLTAK